MLVDSKQPDSGIGCMNGKVDPACKRTLEGD
jgi:hypothetical protein